MQPAKFGAPLMSKPRRTVTVDSSFPGTDCPVGSVVAFSAGGRKKVSGKVTCLRLRRADVVDDQGREWRVPYGAISEVAARPRVDCSLDDVEGMAHRLIGKHMPDGTLAQPWSFGFDLAPARAGVCRYVERRIDLSVNYCLAATRNDIEDTILHEIAHAIVGPRHNHDDVWKRKAREIGCKGERCHRVQQSIPRWVGECGCGRRWFRQTLQRRMMRNRACGKCLGEISWRRNTEAERP